MAHLPAWLRHTIKYRNYLITILWPILICPILIAYAGQPQSKGAYALLLMAGYWVTECIPIYVTGMLPLLLAPLMGLFSSGDACAEYMADPVVLFLFGAFLAVATEHRNLHRRIGVAVMQVMGSDPRFLMLGLMISTWFLSMWMSNAAATIMMLTIVEALMTRLETVQVKEDFEEGIVLRSDEPNGEMQGDDKWVTRGSRESVDGSAINQRPARTDAQSLQKLGCGLSLCIAFASSCGGMGTVIGTPTNVVLFGMLNKNYGPQPSLSFGTWALYGIPLSLCMLLAVWMILGVLFIGLKDFFACKRGGNARDRAIKQILEEEKASLGPVEWAEASTMAILSLVILLWISRKPGVDGWLALLPSKTKPDGTRVVLTSDTQVAVLGTILLCFWPAYNPFKKRLPGASSPPIKPNESVLPWNVAQAKCPFSVLFLIGGGFCLSKICFDSGLSQQVGVSMMALESLPLFALILVFCLVVIIMTTFVANAATATVLLPIVFQVCSNIHVHPLYLGLPVTIAASMAFALPAGTPANAIVYNKGRIQMNQMMISGILASLVGLLLVTAATCSYAIPIFGLNEFPDWANVTIATSTP